MEDYLQRIDARTAWDLGCNRGLFSKIMAHRGIKTIAFDNDHECVDRNYTELKKNGSASPYLPLVLDLSNPSPSIGWENRERLSLLERGPVDLVLALALIHHLAITQNIPFSHIAFLLHR